MVTISTVQVLYLTTYRPFESKLLLRLDIFNEVTTVALVDILCSFTPANTSPMDVEMDLLFLVCLIGNISVHLYFLVKSSVVSAKESCYRKKMRGQRYCCCLRYRRVQYEIKRPRFEDQ